ncbi:MAG TPA: class I SAM-dependent methyltransferase [Candidatus Methanofastidiosa archaeon]|nr:class I SAM-dependent methyltransferase [Candidatus Methanofastidiosa archaeon]
MEDFERYMAEKDRIRSSINSHLFSLIDMIPLNGLKKVMDIGSGTGVTPLALAEKCDSRMICIDIDRPSLDILQKNTAERGLEDRIDILHMDMRDITYPPEYFDMIISEGSVQFIGFDRALYEWGTIIRHGGHLIVHTDALEKERRLEIILENLYELVSLNEISKEEWLNSYVIPLKDLIASTSARPYDDPRLSRQLKKDEDEVQMAMDDISSLGSIIYLMEKI